MAQPVYDDQKEKSPSDEHLRHLTGIGVDEEKAMEREAYSGAADDIEDSSKSTSPEKIKQGEESGSFYKPNKGSGKDESDKLAEHENQIGEGFKSDDKPGRLKKIGGRLSGLSTRQKWLGGGAVGSTIGLVFGLFSILQGPFQLVHLGQVLSRFNYANESVISDRIQSHFRYYRAQKTGDVGETRVSYVGSKIFRKVESQLKAIGVEFERDPRTGRPLTQFIDTTDHPKYRGMSRAEATSAIARELGIPDEAVNRINNGKGGANSHRFAVNWRNYSDKKVRRMSYTYLDQVEDGKIPNWMNKRVMSKFFNIPSLFHPLRATASATENKLAIRSARIAREAERQKTKKPTLKSKYESAKATVAKEVKPYRTAVNATLFVLGGMCTARTIARLIPLVNYGQVVVPAMVSSTDKQAVGSQIQSNQIPSVDQVGDAHEALVDDDGNSVWKGKALNALTYNNEGHGEEIEDDYKQAFSTDSTSNNIVQGINILGNNTLSGFACSNIGLIAQVAVSAGLLVIGPGGWTAKASSMGTSTLVSLTVMNFLQNKAIDALTTDPAKSFAGAQGGNLLAHGARASANLNAMSMGGVALSTEESAYIMNRQYAQESENFKSQGFFARVFDIKNYRSLSAAMIRGSDVRATNSVRGFASSLLNIAKPFSSLGSIFTPRVGAAEVSYDWGFPLYGVPQDILNDSDYEDPYNNADRVANILEGDGSEDYESRSKACYGVDFATTTEGWDVIPASDVNPTEEEYIDADCNDFGDTNWKRVTMFVLDASVSRLLDCYDGGQNSCQQLGFTTTTQPASQSTSVSAGASIEGDPYSDTTSVACATSTKDIGIHDGYVRGKLFKVRLCSIPNMPSSGQADGPGGVYSTTGADGHAIVNSRVSGAWYALAKDAINSGINVRVRSSFRSMAHQQDLFRENPNTSDVARPGYSSHQAGVAIDFEGVQGRGGQTCSSRARDTDNALWFWLYNNADKYGFKQYSSEAWHWDALDASNRCGGP